MTAHQISAALRSLARQRPIDRLRFEAMADDLEAAVTAVDAPTGGEIEQHKLASALVAARNALAEHHGTEPHERIA